MNKKEILDAISQEFQKSLQDIGATNGEVIKMMFPNTTIFVDETHNVVWFELYHDKYDDDFDVDITFTLDWWNTPYKAESEDK